MKLAGYVRVSTAEQAEHGVSLADQRGRLAAHAETLGASLAGVHADAGVSGSVPPDKRPGLAAALGAIAAGEADALLVYSLDRLSRDTFDLLGIQKRVRVLSVRDPSVGDTSATGIASTQMTAVFSELLRNQLKEKTRSALESIIGAGRSASRNVPFGWRTIDGATRLPPARYDERGKRIPDVRELVEHPEEQRQLATMVALRAAGLGAVRIAKTLGVSPRTGAPWNPSTLRSVLATVERRERRRGKG